MFRNKWILIPAIHWSLANSIIFVPLSKYHADREYKSPTTKRERKKLLKKSCFNTTGEKVCKALKHGNCDNCRYKCIDKFHTESITDKRISINDIVIAPECRRNWTRTLVDHRDVFLKLTQLIKMENTKYYVKVFIWKCYRLILLYKILAEWSKFSNSRS